MQMILTNLGILHSIIRFGRMISSIQIRMAILSIAFINYRPEGDKYADQRKVFEQVGQ